MSRRSFAQDQRRSRRACRLDVERCEERTLLSSGLGELTAPGPQDTIPLKAAVDYSLTTLASFDGTNGTGPVDVGGLVRDLSGNLYGTTQLGGAYGQGTVFELAAGSTTITTLASFNGTNGTGPTSLVRDLSGNLYGTTGFGGAYGQGTVFELAAGSTTITTLASFNGTNGTDGAYPVSLVRDLRGNLYGTTTQGGAYDLGTVFELAAGSTTITTLASFNGANGEQPYGRLVRDLGGNLYGTTQGGGAHGDGTVFELAAGSTTITALASFNGTNGSIPVGGLVRDLEGNLYGTTQGGGAHGDGTVFELAAGSTKITTLASFNGTNGRQPVASLERDLGGNLYGTTALGGANDLGTVFELAAGSHTITTLATFDGANGAHPFTGLVRDLRGNLYGTAIDGGAYGQGTVFELSPSRGAS